MNDLALNIDPAGDDSKNLVPVGLEKYYNDKGEVAVLVSYGYGAGWSTWNNEPQKLTMDKTLVEMHLAKTPESEVKEYCKKVFGVTAYMGGWYKIEIEYLPVGTSFKIEEYDGTESLQTYDDLVLTT